MIAFYKTIVDGYIVGVGTNGNTTIGTEITEVEYNEIVSVIHNKPARSGDTDYRLREDFTWEEYVVPPIPADEDIDDTEAFYIIFGGIE